MSRAYDRLRRGMARYVDRPFLAMPLPPKVQRMIFETQIKLNSRGPKVAVTWQEIGGTRARISRPDAPKGRILWLHGGGFSIGSPNTHGPMLDKLAVESGMEVWAPIYPLAPEHPFPAGADTCLAVARAMPGPFHLGGDSAGGNLALVVAQALLADATPPLSLILVSPVVDMSADRRRAPDCDEMLLPEAFLRRTRDGYVGQTDPSDPRVSPVRGAYPGCPPVFVEVCRHEVLEPDGRAIATALEDQGAQVTLHEAQNLPHVYHLYVGLSSAADEGVRRIARFVSP